MKATCEKLAEIDWYEYMASAEFNADPPIQEVQDFIEIADRLAIMADALSRMSKQIADQIAAENQAQK
jgi:hypothetical protein